MSIFLAEVISTYLALAVRPTAALPSTLAHCVALVAVTTATSSRPSRGVGVVEGIDATEDSSHVADDHTAGLPGVELLAVDVDAHLDHGVRHVLDAGQHIGTAPEPILQTAVGITDHQGVRANTGHHTEALTVDPAHVDRADVTGQPDLHGLLEVRRYSHVAREEVSGTRGEHRHRDAGTGEHVQTSLHRAVASPDEDPVDTGVERLAHVLRCLLALGHLEPERVV